MCIEEEVLEESADPAEAHGGAHSDGEVDTDMNVKYKSQPPRLADVPGILSPAGDFPRQRSSRSDRHRRHLSARSDSLSEVGSPTVGEVKESYTDGDSTARPASRVSLRSRAESDGGASWRTRSGSAELFGAIELPSKDKPPEEQAILEPAVLFASLQAHPHWEWVDTLVSDHVTDFTRQAAELSGKGKGGFADTLAPRVKKFLNMVGAWVAKHPVYRLRGKAALEDLTQGALRIGREREGEAPPLEAIGYVRSRFEDRIMRHLHPIVFGTTKSDRSEDSVLAARLQNLQFLTLDNLGVPNACRNEVVLALAQNELQRMNAYLVPEAKLDCVVRSVKVLDTALTLHRKHAKSGEKAAGADDMLPVFIYVVLRARVKHLMSNVLYIERFRDDSALMGAGGYCLVNLRAAIHFLMHIDHTQLSDVSEEDLQKHIGT